ncbi:Poly [ADP-ribose] polymerase 2-like protein [Drosera capensis]
MASKMKVDELRTELSKRNLSTAGTKPSLVRRLEAALRKESKEETGKSVVDDGTGSDSVAGQKRMRDEEECHDDDDDAKADVPEKMSEVKKFRAMGVKKLRDEAALRGVPTGGTKKELIERLCVGTKDGGGSAAGAAGAADADGQVKDEGVEEEEEMVEENEKEKLVTMTKKGAAVLDQWIPDHIKNQYHVLQLGDEIYDAMLNQTNVGDNNNKFYVIQALELDGGGTFMVYNRWGRVGVRGQDKLFGPFTTRDSAVQEFEQKFFAKTKNHWSNRKDFVSHAKYYTWLEMDYSKSEKDTNEEKASRNADIQLRETKLDPRVANFISLVCNISMMKQQMMEIGYNAEKLPLGKLSKSTIMKGYEVLKRIADVIGQPNGNLLEQLSGEFYTAIPHDFGFRKMREFVIDTPQKLKSKLEMVEALGEIELATKLLKEDIEMQEDPLYSQYQRLRCELSPVQNSSDEFLMVEKYLKNTHARTHSNYTVEIVQIFRVSREDEAERFRQFSNAKNRMLLWHGSRLTNWTGILSQGLRIAPPEAPVTGYMFGKGVYFADMFSKSANYCYANNSARTGVLLLCEVALGEMEELLCAKYDADKLPQGKLSTKGVGTTAPDLSEARVLEDGVIVPSGKPVQKSDSKGSLLYNEYIVYNVDQIRMRYVIQVSFNFKR